MHCTVKGLKLLNPIYSHKNESVTDNGKSTPTPDFRHIIRFCSVISVTPILDHDDFWSSTILTHAWHVKVITNFIGAANIPLAAKLIQSHS